VVLLNPNPEVICVGAAWRLAIVHNIQIMPFGGALYVTED
jgi:hypothetical protein